MRLSVSIHYSESADALRGIISVCRTQVSETTGVPDVKGDFNTCFQHLFNLWANHLGLESSLLNALPSAPFPESKSLPLFALSLVNRMERLRKGGGLFFPVSLVVLGARNAVLAG